MPPWLKYDGVPFVMAEKSVGNCRVFAFKKPGYREVQKVPEYRWCNGCVRPVIAKAVACVRRMPCRKLHRYMA